MKIIVNADDLGISESVDDAIFEAIQRGVVTSATLLANGPSLEKAARRTKAFPNCSFGVHLNLTEFKPLCADSRCSLGSILDEDECFNGNSIREVPITAGMLKAVFREWCHQIEFLIRLGVEPSHIDGHHHVHTIPQMLPVLVALRRRYGIRKVRISRNMYHNGEHPTRTLLAKKHAFNWTLQVVGFKTTQIFTDLETFMNACANSAPRVITAELMTHPGSSPGSAEAALLKNHWFQTLPYKVELISYKNL